MEQNPDQLNEDSIDIALAEARVLTDSGCRHSLDEVLALFGYTREQLNAIPEPRSKPRSDVRLGAIAESADERS
jgi:hypothetical protein